MVNIYQSQRDATTVCSVHTEKMKNSVVSVFRGVFYISTGFGIICV